MPWSANTFKSRHNKGLSKPAATRAAKAANAVLKRTGDDGQAVRVGNSIAKKTKP